jgi:hypothetical protein
MAIDDGGDLPTIYCPHTVLDQTGRVLEYILHGRQGEFWNIYCMDLSAITPQWQKGTTHSFVYISSFASGPHAQHRSALFVT